MESQIETPSVFVKSRTRSFPSLQRRKRRKHFRCGNFAFGFFPVSFQVFDILNPSFLNFPAREMRARLHRHERHAIFPVNARANYARIFRDAIRIRDMKHFPVADFENRYFHIDLIVDGTSAFDCETNRTMRSIHLFFSFEMESRGRKFLPLSDLLLFCRSFLARLRAFRCKRE